MGTELAQFFKSPAKHFSLEIPPKRVNRIAPQRLVSTSLFARIPDLLGVPTPCTMHPLPGNTALIIQVVGITPGINWGVRCAPCSVPGPEALALWFAGACGPAAAAPRYFGGCAAGFPADVFGVVAVNWPYTAVLEI